MAIKILEPFLMLGFLIAAGALFYRLKILDLDFCRRLSSVVVKVTFPIMLFVSMYKNVDADTLRRGWIFTALGLGTSVFLAVTAHYSGKKLDLKGRVFGTYQILCTNGNNVFLPVPIISALFGAEYVVYAVLFELGAGFFYWSYGVSHFRSGPRFNLRRLLNPNMVGLVSGLLFGWLGINLPGFMVGGLEILGNITVGSAMLIIGSLVANLLERRIPFRREVWGVLIHRFVLSPAMGVVLLPLLNLPEQLRTILFIMLAMPPLATTALVAASFGGDEDLAAAGVVLPTLLSFVLVPVGLLLF
ncbi:AEC family transporter [Candidatus Darwinibacter acetoxidans]